MSGREGAVSFARERLGRKESLEPGKRGGHRVPCVIRAGGELFPKKSACTGGEKKNHSSSEEKKVSNRETKSLGG